MDILNNVNATLNRALSDVNVRDTLRLFLILYGGLAAPTMPLSFSKHLSNTWVRLAVLVLMLWVANQDVGLAVLIATVYLVSMTFATKRAIQQVTETMSVSEDARMILASNSGPSIKPDSVIDAEHQIMDYCVGNGEFAPFQVDQMAAPLPKPVVPESTYAVNPEAVFSPKMATPNAGLPQIPAQGTQDYTGASLTDDSAPDVPLGYALDSTLMLVGAEVEQ